MFAVFLEHTRADIARKHNAFPVCIQKERAPPDQCLLSLEGGGLDSLPLALRAPLLSLHMKSGQCHGLSGLDLEQFCANVWVPTVGVGSKALSLPGVSKPASETTPGD